MQNLVNMAELTVICQILKIITEEDKVHSCIMESHTDYKVLRTVEHNRNHTKKKYTRF